MAWYVRANDNTFGPVDDAQVVEWIRSGKVLNAKICKVGEQEWADISTHPPFASELMNAAPPPPPADGAASSSAGARGPDVLGYVLLVIPLAATVLVWLWVGNMNLLQDPSTTLTTVMISTVLLTSLLIAVDASQLGFGKRAVENGKIGNGPVAWFFVSVLLWIVAFPWYMHKRLYYGRNSLVIGATLVALVFVGSGLAMNAGIEQSKAQVRERFSNALGNY